MDWPKWANELQSKFRANIAHQFIVYGNIEDYFFSKANEPLRFSNFFSTFLTEWQDRWDIIVFYNCSSGLHFADEGSKKPQMRDKFYQAIGRPTPEAVAEGAGQINIYDDPSRKLRRDQESRQSQNALPLLEKLLLNNSYRSAVIIEYAEAIVPNGEFNLLLPEKIESIITLQRWANSININKTGNLVILMTERLFDLHPNIRDINSRIETIEVPFPSPQERANWVEFYLKFRHPDVPIEEIKAEKVTTGFNLMAIEDLWLRAKESNQPVSLAMIKEKKQAVQKAESSDLLTIIEPEDDFDQIGGLKTQKEDFKFLAKKLIEGDPNMPSGALLLGPPGTGKSVLARALAKEVDIPLIQFLDIQEKWVGASERNMRRALESLKRYDQAIVFIDEFDQAYGGRGSIGDSGVTSRLFGTLLEFMGDPKYRGKIFWLGATNRPDRIDPAMKRPGRFSLQFLLFPPNEEERQDIFIVMFDKRLKILHQIKNFSQAVAKTKDPVTGRGYTGAEIELICSWSKDIAESKGRKSVTEKDLLEAIDDFRPTRDPSYELMTLLAVQCCNSKRQIPEPYCSMSDEEINKNIYELRVRLGNVFPGI